jgi:hypothetical protein
MKPITNKYNNITSIKFNKKKPRVNKQNFRNTLKKKYMEKKVINGCPNNIIKHNTHEFEFTN